MMKAVIDIGSNSIKMRIALTASGKIRVIRDETEVTKLARGMSTTGLLDGANMERSCRTVCRMVKTAQRLGAEIFIAGTMALRYAGNSAEFVKMVRSSCGHDVHILTGGEEAKYSWLGAVDGLNVTGEAVMFDTGGGSTEFVSGNEAGIMRSVSVPVGAVNLTEKFFADGSGTVRNSVCKEAVKYVEALFTDSGITSFTSGKCRVIAVGGGVVAMSGVKNACENFVPSRLHATVLTRRDIVRQINLYSSLTLKERGNIIGLPPSRAEVILASACIVLGAVEILGAESLTVSINGLRQGLLIEAGC